MKPVVFDGCFGWLHAAAGAQGVVLCNPFGYDALCTHRSWRRLAERIAAGGRPALRFDYPGAGDSTGVEEDPERLDAWIDSIVAAVRHLRERTGVRHVTLIGLRLGATLAALAAQRMRATDGSPVDGLVMLAPPVTGRNYVRELRAHRLGWLSTPGGMSSDPLDDGDNYVEAFGFGLHGGDIARLSQIDLLADTTAPAPRVLVLDSNDRRRAAALVGHYAGHGIDAVHEDFDECDRLMAEALLSEEPSAAFARVCAWLEEGPARADAGDPAIVPDRAGMPARLPLPEIGAVEKPVEFAVSRGTCFGMYCEPFQSRSEAPAVLFVNTGANHHIGDGRAFVLLARRLAARGVASMRMDVGGFGDSTPTADAMSLDAIYADDSWRDAMLGADWLVAHGHARVAVMGVCGGAFVSLHACAHHPAIVGAFCINLQKFTWTPGRGNDAAPRHASSKVYWRAALQPGKWLRALRGQSHPLRAMKVVGMRLVRRLWSTAMDFTERKTGFALVSTPACRLMRAIQNKRANVKLIYSEFDVGLDEARAQFGTGLAGLQRDGVRASTLAKLDHALFTRVAREAALAEAQRWLFDELSCAPSSIEAAAVATAPIAPIAPIVPGWRHAAQSTGSDALAKGGVST